MSSKIRPLFSVMIGLSLALAGALSACSSTPGATGTPPSGLTCGTSADCAAGVAKPYLFGSQIRARHTLVDAGAHNQSATFSVSAFLQ